MMTLRLKRIFVLAAILAIAACKTASSDKPAPPVPAASQAPVSLPLPASAPAPVSGAPTTTPPSSGSPAPAAGTPGTDQKSSDASGNPETSEERRVAVAQRLDESLGTFDATLRKEQADLAKAREQRADDAAKAADKGGEGVEDVKADAGVDPDKETAKNERRGGMKSEADPGKDSKGTSEDNGAAETGDVGEGHVDDIVGRQICEAAQRETDPELKEKLMKECKAYRDGTH
jgi:hypothetical protein